MKIAIINDSHFGVKNSSEVFFDYFNRFYRDIFFPYCETHGIKQIIHAGDYYDSRRSIDIRALNKNRKTFLNYLKDSNMHMDIIPGNHDVSYKNTNDICSLKELLGYFINNISIVMRPTTCEYDGYKIGLLPWINEENETESFEFIKTCPARTLIAHLDIVGFDMMKGIKSTHGHEREIFDRYNRVLTGHYHTRSTTGNIYYLGSQYEMTWADCDDPKFFHVFDTATEELTPVRNPFTIYKKIYYDDRYRNFNNESVEEYDNHFVKIIISERTDKVMFENFVDRLQTKVNLHKLEIIESYDAILNVGEDDEEGDETGSVSLNGTVPELLLKYAKTNTTPEDSEKIKTKLMNLYTEALNSDRI